MDPLQTIYFGGGTPSLWGEHGAEFILDFFHKNNFKINTNYEWTIEIGPGSVTKNELTKWKKVGVNRFSLGIQTLDRNLFQYVDRNYSLDKTREVLQFFKKTQVDFSVDFLLGIPFTQKFGRSIEDELQKVIGFGAKHISLYFLTVPKHYVHYNSLPKEDWICDEYFTVCKTLGSLGFNHYEVANFGLEGFESKHNRRYWGHESVLALGPSASGFLNLPENRTRFRWSTNWRDPISNGLPKCDFEYLSEKEIKIERVYLILRQGNSFKKESFPINKERLNELEIILFQWVKSGYLTLDQAEGGFKMTPSGWLILDTLVQEILTFVH